MPYKIESVRLPRRLNRRVKLTDEDKAEIRGLYSQLGMTIRGIARQFEHKCTRRMIQMVLFPDRYEAAKARSRARKKVYNAKYNAAAVRKTRQYKRQLQEAGALRLAFYTEVQYKSRPAPKYKPRVFYFATMAQAEAAAGRLAARGAYVEAGRLERDGLTVLAPRRVCVSIFGRRPRA